MAVLKCGNCTSKVESNRCCGKPMNAVKGKLECGNCKKQVEINHCCGETMNILPN